MSTPNSQVPSERDFYTESLTAAKLSDASGRLNASTQNETSVQSLITPGSITTNPRYKQPSSFLEDVANRYLI
jgi:hypothetical protein